MDWAIAQKENYLAYNRGDNKYDLKESIEVCDTAIPKPVNQ